MREVQGLLDGWLQVDDAPSRPRDVAIPGFRILQELGQGGMGAVYLAEQEQPVRRRVALKLIKTGMDNRAIVGA